MSTLTSHVEIQVTRKAIVFDAEDKPAMEITKIGDIVSIKQLPQNASKKREVRLNDLMKALEQLNAAKD